MQGRILIIEDEYNLADAISETLNREGFSVKVETDGEKGEDEAIANVYDIILFPCLFILSTFIIIMTNLFINFFY